MTRKNACCYRAQDATLEHSSGSLNINFSFHTSYCLAIVVEYLFFILIFKNFLNLLIFGERNIDLLLHLFLNLLVASWMYPDQGLNPQPWCIRWRFNQLSLPGQDWFWYFKNLLPPETGKFIWNIIKFCKEGLSKYRNVTILDGNSCHQKDMYWNSK